MPSLSYYLARERIIGFIPFPRVLVLCEMQLASSSIWTHVVMSVSYNAIHYAIKPPPYTISYIHTYIYICVCVCAHTLYIYIYIYVLILYTYIYIHICMHVHIHTNTHIYIRIYFTYTYIPIYVHIFISKDDNHYTLGTAWLCTRENYAVFTHITCCF